MGESLEWYRREICKREGHTHGDAGELDCILIRLAEIRARQRESGSEPANETKPTQKHAKA